jgi:hypothetical protein
VKRTKISRILLFIILIFRFCILINAESIKKTDSEYSTEFKKAISGIWYHTKDISTQLTMKRNFSWGQSSYDYFNSLCIDLLGEKTYFQYSDGGWNTIDIISIDNSAYTYTFALGNMGTLQKDEVIIVIKNNVMEFRFVNNNVTLFEEDVTGFYYKLAGPGTNNLDGEKK